MSAISALGAIAQCVHLLAQLVQQLDGPGGTLSGLSDLPTVVHAASGVTLSWSVPTWNLRHRVAPPLYTPVLNPET